MTAARAGVAAALVVLAVSLQIGFFSTLAVAGVVPDVALLVVVAAALARGPEYAAVLGFAAGLALDLAPPADHTVGRWALALVVTGYLAGLVRHDAYRSAVAAVLTVAASAFIGTSVFALSGLVLGDASVSVEAVLRVVAIAVCYDVALTPLVLPPVGWLLRRTVPMTARWAPA
jgi:rod shape-determining protein MreD